MQSRHGAQRALPDLSNSRGQAFRGQTKKVSVYYTDTFRSYNSLKRLGKHHKLNHSKTLIEHYVKNIDFSNLFKDWGDDLKERIAEFSKEMNLKDPENYGHERSLIAILV